MIEELAASLRRVNLDVTVVEGTLNVVSGRGPLARKANLDPTEVLRAADERERGDVARYLAGYATGVQTVLLEPKRSRAAEWTFVESAGSLLPTVQVESFGLGVRDAAGGPAWTQPLQEDLVVGWTMRLPQGMRAVTTEQVEAWGVTTDRIVSAGRSLLFHTSRNADWSEDETNEAVRVLQVGDGFDAARVLVVADIFFADVTPKWRFAMPDPDALLAVESPEDVDALRAVLQRRLDESDYPLSDAIFEIQRGHPVVAEVS